MTRLMDTDANGIMATGAYELLEDVEIDATMATYVWFRPAVAVAIQCPCMIPAAGTLPWSNRLSALTPAYTVVVMLKCPSANTISAPDILHRYLPFIHCSDRMRYLPMRLLAYEISAVDVLHTDTCR